MPALANRQWQSGGPYLQDTAEPVRAAHTRDQARQDLLSEQQLLRQAHIPVQPVSAGQLNSAVASQIRAAVQHHDLALLNLITASAQLEFRGTQQPPSSAGKGNQSYAFKKGPKPSCSFTRPS